MPFIFEGGSDVSEGYCGQPVQCFSCDLSQFCALMNRSHWMACQVEAESHINNIKSIH